MLSGHEGARKGGRGWGLVWWIGRSQNFFSQRQIDITLGFMAPDSLSGVLPNNSVITEDVQVGIVESNL